MERNARTPEATSLPQANDPSLDPFSKEKFDSRDPGTAGSVPSLLERPDRQVLNC